MNELEGVTMRWTVDECRNRRKNTNELDIIQWRGACAFVSGMLFVSVEKHWIQLIHANAHQEEEGSRDGARFADLRVHDDG